MKTTIEIMTPMEFLSPHRHKKNKVKVIGADHEDVATG